MGQVALVFRKQLLHQAHLLKASYKLRSSVKRSSIESLKYFSTDLCTLIIRVQTRRPFDGNATLYGKVALIL